MLNTSFHNNRGTKFLSSLCGKETPWAINRRCTCWPVAVAGAF